MNSPFVIITGMHRSGTSFLSRALNMSGLFLGPLDSIFSFGLESSEDNLRGHWENTIIKELCDVCLQTNHSFWDSPIENIIIDNNLAQEIKQTITSFYLTDHLACGFKDPRMCLLFDSWKDFFPKNTVLVGIFRHPLLVAESLKKRNNFSYEKSLELWKVYNLKLLKHLENTNGFLLNFDWENQKLFDQIHVIATKLGLINNMDFSLWYDKNLKHSDVCFNKLFELPEDIQLLYEKLKTYSEQNNSKPKIESEHDSQKIIRSLLMDSFFQHESFLKFLKDKDVYLEQVIKDKDVSLEQVIKDKDVYLEQVIKCYTEQINNIKNSKSWKIFHMFDKNSV